MVEKGLWYNIFHLEGGWHVHLKLQFVLSDEERNRIRAMVCVCTVRLRICYHFVVR